jgi:hypothetical protein
MLVVNRNWKAAVLCPVVWLELQLITVSVEIFYHEVTAIEDQDLLIVEDS